MVRLSGKWLGFWHYAEFTILKKLFNSDIIIVM
jgi:hypothetical protein